MSKRITLITLFDNKEINKINNLMQRIQEKTCKVPYGLMTKIDLKLTIYHFILLFLQQIKKTKI